ncbi:translation initiation factor [Candidatus Woesearchaeota archaeon]|nr:translation initiation factor [Candidatus Woesearchaeota archaeon]
MSNVCQKCGLPLDLCMCEEIAKEDQKIIIKLEKRRFGKMITTIEGIKDKSIDLKELTKKLKSKLACGGTMKNGLIELQGNHVGMVKRYLLELGFPAETLQTG